ncbi:LysR family transcriptional regulator [Bordetella petrii]|nr:LysR family transcriptional regulator [Bordetella petrii]
MAHPTFKQLEAIYWTGRLGSFQAAAKQLHTSQSAIAKRIAELQTMFDTDLVDLKQRRAKLTESGQRLMKGAEELLAARLEVVNDVLGPANFSGTLCLGASELVAITWLPAFIEQLRLAYPRVTVELIVQQSGLLLERIKAGTLHIALIGGPFWDSSIESVELQDVAFAWMASPRLKIPNRILTAPEVSGYPMLVHTSQGIVSQIFDNWQRMAGFKPQKVITANSLTVTIHMTINGLGISPLPVDYVQKHIDEGTLVRVRTSPALPDVKYFAVHQNPTDFPLTLDVIKIALHMCNG